MDPMTTTLIPDVLTSVELAERWRVTDGSLRTRRTRGTGPAFFKIGTTVVYLLSTVQSWEQAHGITPHTEREATA